MPERNIAPAPNEAEDQPLVGARVIHRLESLQLAELFDVPL